MCADSVRAAMVTSAVGSCEDCPGCSNVAGASLRCNPIFLMRDSKVLGFTPSNSAAPWAPLIFQPVFFSAMRTLSRSRRCNSDSVRNSGSGRLATGSVIVTVGGLGTVVGRSNSRAPPRAKITARSITLRSSRIFPGQSWFWSAAIPAGVSRGFGHFVSFATISMKCLAR